MTAVVFGASGNVGRHVTAGLLAAGQRVRVTSRKPDGHNFDPGVEVVAADLDRPETLPAALAGADTVFLYAKPDGVDGFVAAAGSAGVRQVVLLSSAAVIHADPERNPIARQHRTVESALERSGLAWTFIRPGVFATNALWWWRAPIRAGEPVRLPYPDAHTAPVHEKDMAALAVTALTEPGHEGKSYTVYGPESLTLRQQIDLIGAALDRPIAVEEVAVDEARADMTRSMPAVAVDAVLGLWAAGTAAPAEVSTVVAEVTGRPAHTFAQWSADHAPDFR